MVVDVVQLAVAVSDIDKMLKVISQITESVDPLASLRVVALADHITKLTTGRFTLHIARKNKIGAESSLIPVKPLSQSTVRSSVAPVLSSSNAKPFPTAFPKPSEACHQLAGTRVQSMVRRLSREDREQITLSSTEILFTAQFVLLVKYVEAVTPAIYGNNVIAAKQTVRVLTSCPM